MQSLAQCMNRQYFFAKRLCGYPLKSNWREYAIFGRKLASKTVNVGAASRLWDPVAVYVCRRLERELIALSALCTPVSSARLPGLCNNRFLHTGPPRRNRDDGSKGSSGKDNKDDPKKGNREEQVQILQKLAVIAFAIYIIVSLTRSTSQMKQIEQSRIISWSEFEHQMLAKGEVEHVYVDRIMDQVQVVLARDAVYKGRVLPHGRFFISVSDASSVERRIREVEDKLGIRYGEGVPITYVRHGENLELLLRLFWIGVIASVIIFMMNKGNGMKSFNIFQHLTRAKYTLVEPFTSKGVKFEDVAGLKDAKIEVMEFVDYLKQPSRYRALGAKMPKGVLLLGPPGCGKTMLAKAVATESNVPFLSMNGSEFIEMLGGLGAARVRDLFREGKKRAPSIIYIDEIDAIGKKRFEEGGGNSESDRTLNQLLVEMDGMGTNTNVIVLASTNRDEVLDKALLRPGRFDRQITIEMPKHEERKQIFESHLKSLILKNPPSTYSDYLASFTPGFSGADIANVCNEAALHAARYKKKYVDRDDLVYAIDRVIGGMVKKTGHLPEMKKTIAYYEAGHAVVGWLSKNADPILKVSIVPRTNKKHGYTQHELSEAFLYSKEYIFDKICMLLGGRVAEYIMFNQTSVAAEADLKKVTKLAYDQVRTYGMSSAIGLVSFPDPKAQLQIKGKKPYSKKLGNLIDAEVNNILDQAYKRTQKLLLDNKDKLIAVGEALLERETLLHNDIEKLIGPPVHGRKPHVQLIETEPQVKEDPVTEQRQN